MSKGLKYCTFILFVPLTYLFCFWAASNWYDIGEKIAYWAVPTVVTIFSFTELNRKLSGKTNRLMKTIIYSILIFLATSIINYGVIYLIVMNGILKNF